MRIPSTCVYFFCTQLARSLFLFGFDPCLDPRDQFVRDGGERCIVDDPIRFSGIGVDTPRPNHVLIVRTNTERMFFNFVLSDVAQLPGCVGRQEVKMPLAWSRLNCKCLGEWLVCLAFVVLYDPA